MSQVALTLVFAGLILFGIWVGRQPIAIGAQAPRSKRLTYATLLLMGSPFPPLVLLLACSALSLLGTPWLVIALLGLGGLAMVAMQVLAAKTLVGVLASDVTPSPDAPSHDLDQGTSTQ